MSCVPLLDRQKCCNPSEGPFTRYDAPFPARCAQPSSLLPPPQPPLKRMAPQRLPAVTCPEGRGFCRSNPGTSRTHSESARKRGDPRTRPPLSRQNT